MMTGDLQFDGPNKIKAGQMLSLPNTTDIELSAEERIFVPGKGEKSIGKLTIGNNIKKIKALNGDWDRNIEKFSKLERNDA